MSNELNEYAVLVKVQFTTEERVLARSRREAMLQAEHNTRHEIDMMFPNRLNDKDGVPWRKNGLTEQVAPANAPPEKKKACAAFCVKRFSHATSWLSKMLCNQCPSRTRSQCCTVLGLRCRAKVADQVTSLKTLLAYS